MARMTLAELRKLRDQKRGEMDMRDSSNKNIQIIVGMGTSGIANGAKDTLNAFVEILRREGLTNVAVKQTGGLGLDHAEPTVEVRMPEMPTVIYGRVDRKVAERIVNEHIQEKRLVDEHVYDRPAPDIVEEQE
ncbi:MAG: (2Fe-2S) ferredoxin domain-containing protein [Alkalispirochaetaceae bacterium]